MEEKIRACFLGLAVGDALGVPVEFRQRSFLDEYPVTTMLGYGTWNQPPGTWSDDSSMTFCSAESLTKGYDLNDIARTFLLWYREGYWGAHHKLFDIGGTTRSALGRILEGEDPKFSGDFGVESNGNGSLMRIAPAAIYFMNLSDEELYKRITEISGITHAHFRSTFSCFIFAKFLIELMNGKNKENAFTTARTDVSRFATDNNFNMAEVKLFQNILSGAIPDIGKSCINSSGYVLHTLEASIWCFLTTDSYSDCVLKAVNLGEDTDTTACVSGALAGTYYGMETIPAHWRSGLARGNDILKLAQNFSDSIK